MAALKRLASELKGEMGLPKEYDGVVRQLEISDAAVKKLLTSIADATEGAAGPVEAKVRQVEECSDDAFKVGASVMQPCELVFAKAARRERTEYCDQATPTHHVSRRAIVGEARSRR